MITVSFEHWWIIMHEANVMCVFHYSRIPSSFITGNLHVWAIRQAFSMLTVALFEASINIIIHRIIFDFQLIQAPALCRGAPGRRVSLEGWKTFEMYACEGASYCTSAPLVWLIFVSIYISCDWKWRGWVIKFHLNQLLIDPLLFNRVKRSLRQRAQIESPLQKNPNYLGWKVYHPLNDDCKDSTTFILETCELFLSFR